MPPLNTLSKSCLALAISQALVTPVHAATIEVDSARDFYINDFNPVDPTICTLREATTSMNRGELEPGCVNTGSAFGIDDTVNIGDSLSGETITLANDYYVTLFVSDTTINGNGATITLDPSTVGPLLSARGTTTLNDLHLTAGRLIVRGRDNLTIANSTISGARSSSGIELSTLGMILTHRLVLLIVL